MTNTYAAMLVFSLMILSQTTNAVKADLFGSDSLIVDKQSNGCRLLGFFTYETFGCFYMTFVLQAFYRLTRVVYSKHRFLQ
ncbi:unnamed protein product, partial [Rotaria sp. Silwood2]